MSIKKVVIEYIYLLKIGLMNLMCSYLKKLVMMMVFVFGSIKKKNFMKIVYTIILRTLR